MQRGLDTLIKQADLYIFVQLQFLQGIPALVSPGKQTVTRLIVCCLILINVVGVSVRSAAR